MSVKKKLLPIKTPSRIGFLSFLGDLGGCGILRTVTPYLLLNYLKIPKISVHTSYFSQYIGDTNFYKNFSFIQFQRSATEAHLNIHRKFRQLIQPKHKIPLIYEIDDLLMDIPKWNFAHTYYRDNVHHIEAMMRESDGIVVSTHPLRKIYSKYNKNIKVIPNHLAKFIWGDIKPKHERYEESNKIRILWAGSQNHFKHPSMKSSSDGGDLGNELMDFIKRTTDVYEWVFMGALPMELEDVKGKIEFHDWQNTFEYPNYLKSLNADIGIAPLQKGEFNDSKSNIKALEFTASGIPGIYSNVAPYNLMKMKCDTEEYMIDRIEALAKDVELRERIWNDDYKTLKGQLWWEENDNLRKYVSTYLSFMGRRLP